MKEIPEIVEQLRRLESSGKIGSISSRSHQNYTDNNHPEDCINLKTTLYNNERILMSDIIRDGVNDDLDMIVNNSRMLFELSPEAIAITDKNGNMIDANNKLYQWLGYQIENLKGMNFLEMPFFTNENISRIKNIFSNETIDSKLLSHEMSFITKEKEKKVGMVHINPIRDSKNKITGDIIMISDITGLKMAEEEINKLSQFHKSIIDNANIWLSVMDLHSNVLVWNKAAESITGYSSDEVMGDNRIWDWLKPDNNECQNRYTTKGNSHINGNIYSENFETLIKRKDGKIRTISWSPHVLIDNMKNPIGNIALGRDITEEKQSEEKIKKQNFELKKLNKIKSDFLNVTSHELRTPMVAIKGYAQLLSDLSLGKMSEKQKKAIDVILRNTNRLNNLVQDILDVSRLESGTMKFIPSDTNIKKLIEETVETMQQSANSKQIKIKMEINGKLPCLLIDPERVKQVLVNLINNAIKFSPTVSIINIRTENKENYVVFEVQDFGRGIPKDKQDRVFEVFYQVDSSKDRKILGGAGMGLAISKGIILAHGGNISVDSKPSKGSTFSFTLPHKPVKNLEERFKKINIFPPQDCKSDVLDNIIEKRKK